MRSEHVHCRLSDDVGADNDGGDVTLYDIRAYTAALITTLDWTEMRKLIEWYTDGTCPVCGEDINAGEVICDSCYDRASRFGHRAGDGRDPCIEELKRNRRMGTFDNV
jgi:predicted amidophosphoribosyltransferase